MPEVVALIDCEVAPVFQRYVNPAPLFALSTTLPPAQNVVGPAAVIVARGGVDAVTVTGDDVALQPPLAVTVTVNVPLVLTVIDCVDAPFDQE